MLKTADQTRDLSGQDAHRILSIYPVPDYVKTASRLQKCGAADQPRSGFADPINKLYPAHTAAATWLSAAFFYTKHAEEGTPAPPTTEGKLLAAARHFGVLPDIESLNTLAKAAALNDETQLADSDFAILLRYDDGRVERKYPMRNAMETKTAAEYLHNYRAEFPYQDRQRIAYKIIEKAAEYGADISELRDELDRTAGYGTCAAVDAADMLRTRALTIRQKNAEVAAVVQDLAQSVVDKGVHFRHFDKMSEIAGIVDQIDREYGLINGYSGGKLGFPEDTLFAITAKVAVELSNELVTLANGSVYSRGDLELMPVDVYEQALNEKVAAVTTADAMVVGDKVATFLPKLSVHDADVFDIAAGAAGVIPVAKSQAKTAFSRVSDPAVQAAVAAYRPAVKPGSLWDRVSRKTLV